MSNTAVSTISDHVTVNLYGSEIDAFLRVAGREKLLRASVINILKNRHGLTPSEADAAFWKLTNGEGDRSLVDRAVDKIRNA